MFSAYVNTTSSNGIDVVYSPPDVSTVGPLSLNLTVAGILQNGKTVPIPDGLQVYWPNQVIGLAGCCAPYVAEYDNFTGGAPSNSFSVTLPVDYPYYFDIGFNVSSMPVGTQYTVVLNETVNGQSLIGYLSLTIEPTPVSQ